ncbi:MAG TPA: hypothetical protein VK835_04320 [Bacteroidia bacterium]|nr:hypothetical protein [Bacteroidia bacterium]
MKKNLVLFSMAFCFMAGLTAQQQAVVLPKKTFAVKEICKTTWDTPKGLSYKKVAGANLGVVSFEVMDKKRVAYLSDAVNEISIADKITGHVTDKFAVAAAPHDFVYDKNNFYVLYENGVLVYDEKGTLVKIVPYPSNLVGAMRVARYNKGTYLLMPSGNSVQIENAEGKAVVENHKGWITETGLFVLGQLNGANAYKIQVSDAGGKSYEKTFTTTLKTAGVYVVGANQNRLVLDVQTYVSESPIQVERHIVSIELSGQGLGNVVSDIKTPDCYYVLSNKDVVLANDGTVLDMVTAPQGLMLFLLTETTDEKAAHYPSELRTMKYHFNDHLLQASDKNK